MSLILDALNRAEHDRKNQDAVPDLNTLHSPQDLGAGGGGARLQLWWIIGAAIVLAALIIVLVLLLRREASAPALIPTPSPHAVVEQPGSTGVSTV